MKTIIVTGASRGIGEAVCRYLIAHGHNIVAIARSQAPLEMMKANAPDQVRFIAGDLRDFSLAQNAVNMALKEFKQLDGLVINHGVMTKATRLEHSSIDEWKSDYDVNVFSAVAFVKAAIPELRKSRGSVIFTSSGAAITFYSAWGTYGSSKACINHIAATLAAEEPDITSIALRPGVVDTQMQQDIKNIHTTQMSERDAKRFADLRDEGKLLKPEKPGNVIAKLAIEAPRELSGRFISWNADELADLQEKE